MSTTTPSTSSEAPERRRSTTVEGVFHDRGSVTRAVEALAEKSVPADSVRVFVRDRSGERRREVPVEDESGALRGAIIGAGVGAVLGLAIAVAVGAGMLGATGTGILSLEGLTGALGAILAAAAAGVPLGGLLGMGYWRGRKRIADVELEEGTAVVVVESDELSPLAQDTLRDAGASDVTVSRPRPSVRATPGR